MKSILNYFITFTLVFVFTSFVAEADTVDKIIAKVGSEVITLSDVAQSIAQKRAYYIQRFGKKKGVQEFLKFKKDALNELILMSIMTAQIKKAGISISDSELATEYQMRLSQMRLSEGQLIGKLQKEGISLRQYKANLKEEVERTRFVQKKIMPYVAISDYDLQKEYEKNISKFQKYSKLRFIEVFLTPSKLKDASSQAAMAKKIQGMLKRGQNVSTLIKKYSSGAFAAKGGDSGLVDAKTLRPEIQMILSQLKKGQTSPVMPIQHGTFVFKLLSKSNPKPIPFNEVVNQIRSEYSNKYVEEELKRYLMSVKDQTYVEIHK